MFKKNIFNDDKIYYVNGNSTDTESYLTTNIVNSENFRETGYFIYTDFFALNNKLLFSGTKQLSGSELYTSEFDIATLDSKDFYHGSRQGEVILSPNPTHDKVKIFISDNSVILDVKIFDMLGKLVHIPSRSYDQLDVSSLKDGLYIVKVSTNKSSSASKLIVKK